MSRSLSLLFYFFLSPVWANSNLVIPVKYLPYFDSSGSPMKYGSTTVKVPTKEVAFVIIDFWNIHDPKPGDRPQEALQRTQELLSKLRSAGVKVIYASGDSMVRKFAQNIKIKSEIASRNIEWSVQRQGLANEIHEWLSRSKNPILEDLRKLKHASRSQSRAGEITFSKLLKPEASDYVVENEEEFRLALWKEKVRVVLYAGASLNQCVLSSPQGVQNLASFAEIIPIIVSDCVLSEPTPSASKEQNHKVLLDFAAITSAVLTDSKSIQVTR